MSDDAQTIDDFSMDGTGFVILVNDEGQYSLWPSAKAVPDGWARSGPSGTKDECMAYVDRVWTDLAPNSAKLS